MTAGQVQDIPAETIGASYGDTLPAAAVGLVPPAVELVQRSRSSGLLLRPALSSPCRFAV
jgi:hypothetical protein